MDKEIEEIVNLEDKEFSEENISDTSYEDDDSEMPDPKEAGKANLNENQKCDLRKTSNQIALDHLKMLYPPEIQQIVNSSEESILNLFEFISGDVLNCVIRPNTEDEATGSKILKGVYLLNIIKDNFTISLKRESVSRFLAKAFEYLLNFDLNWVISAKIIHNMNKLKFRCFNLSFVHEMFKVLQAREVFLKKVFERSIYQISNIKIGQDMKAYVISTMLKLISKINYVFKDDFKRLYEYKEERNLTFLEQNGVTFSYHFFPLKYFAEEEFHMLVNEVMFYRTCDIKMKSRATTTFFVRAVKNKYFTCTNEILQRIFYDVKNLALEIKPLTEANKNMYIEHIAYILAHISFSRLNSQVEFENTLTSLVGYFESIIDYCHPLTPKSFEVDYHRSVFTNFLNTFSKQFKKYRDNRKVDVDRIKDQLLPVIRRILSFAVVGPFWEGLGDALYDVCCLDEDYFLEEILRRIKLCMDFDEFKKVVFPNPRLIFSKLFDLCHLF